MGRLGLGRLRSKVKVKSLRSASRLSYRKPALTSKFSERAFSYAGPAAAAWNSLPDHIQSITNTASFKRQLKTFLFSACSYY